MIGENCTWAGLKVDKPQVNGIDDFIPYFDRTGWVVNLLQPEGSGTNNDLEGWHRKVKEIAGKNHLNIFEIIELVKKEQASTKVKIRHACS